MKVSVVIPFRDNFSELSLCLAALREQTLPAADFEVLAVNNSGAQVPAELRARHGSVQWLNDAGPGSYSARNTGIRSARGSVLAFTDADCRPEPAWLANGIARLESGPATVVGGRIKMIDPVTRPLNVFEIYEDLRFGLGHQRRNIQTKGFCATACLLTWKSVLDRVGLFNASLTSGGDRDWIERAILAGELLGYGEDVVVCHPRRADFWSILRKTRRISAGQARLLILHEAPWAARLRTVYGQSPLRWRTHAFAWRAPGVVGALARLRFFLLAEAFFLAATTERIRIFVGGRPPRQ